ncbi:MAG: tRNA pseudouridine(38-40) synthase [Firmicutes bacterium]|nr:tRNA pseudouridine(38-40) synthase [Bacillota bacterium]MDI6705916.1 tRNA pseudouridine(38-40) synthase TruA [Bacillota bacterium]
MRNILITLEYDGTGYHGWQKQKNALGIQEVVEEGIMAITGEKVGITGAGRTDAGVHALDQKANFKTHSSIPVDKIPLALNSVLPRDIRIIGAEEVSLDFHARYNVIKKRYRYRIYNALFPTALFRNFCFHISDKLDIGNMTLASEYLVGRNDYTAFCSTGSNVKTKVRTIEYIKITKEDNMIDIVVQADGFLYNMARIIAGTLVEVGKGNMEIQKVKEILERKDRRFAGPTLPPQGLYLEKVCYNQNS